jgi:transketolase
MAIPCQTSRPTTEIKLIANSMRHDIITELEASQSGHPGGSLSAADIMATLCFSGLMHYDPKNPDDHSQDHFILSKGHAAPVLYATFHQLGWLDDADMLTLRQLGSKLQGHPDAHACPGVEACSGSLGQGLSVSAGIALGLKMDAERDGSAARRVFCLLGDGEMQEGSNWEAMMFAAHHKLDNLVAFLDLNNLQIDGHVTDVCSLGDIDAKFASFGWYVQRVDGHDVDAIEQATKAALAHTGCPSVVICKTIKGKGVSFMEDKQGWHGVAPDADQAAEAIAELDAQRAELEKEVRNG